MEMPALLYPGRKPVGNVEIDWNNPIAKDLKSVEVFHLTSGAHLLDGSIGSLRAGTGNIIAPDREGLALIGGSDTDDGLEFGVSSVSPISLHNESSLTLLFVMRLVENFTVEAGIFVERPAGSGTGISVTVPAADALRCLIATTGTSIWTAAQDEDITSFLGKYCVVGMTYDGSNRHVYIGEVGGPISLLRSDACTGTVNIASYATIATPVIGGGLTDNVFGQGSIYSGIISRKCLSSSQVDAYCRNPYQFLVPA